MMTLRLRSVFVWHSPLFSLNGGCAGCQVYQTTGMRCSLPRSSLLSHRRSLYELVEARHGSRSSSSVFAVLESWGAHGNVPARAARGCKSGPTYCSSELSVLWRGVEPRISKRADVNCSPRLKGGGPSTESVAQLSTSQLAGRGQDAERGTRKSRPSSIRLCPDPASRACLRVRPRCAP
ncbi:hypothetical protein BDZ90DRAFT_173485 [Jaminaea rosea]|uniref:Secreted protein n=1 Tax=Jaminaea rosea TaxID=1569628 RepID=A0A316UVB2_9BASI|nr:hypothetical protein BDZ90DRAFT_173485 [Jaminaea rosea]PWN27853.1 hypothetical protein BDZ90DRAFT_173485 [Jaminaea rosea]